MALNFDLDEFNQTLTMDVSGALDASAVDLADVSAAAVFQVDLAAMRATFKFSTDSSDIDTINDATDVKYHIDETSFPAINPVNATLHSTWTGDAGMPAGAVAELTGAILAGAEHDNSHMSIKHDFVRYLALNLFNTARGVDLFNNESELLQNLVSKGLTMRNTDMSNALVAADGLDNGTQDITNLGRVLITQLQATATGRARLATTVNTVSHSNPAAIPFVEDDTLSFVVTVNSDPNQHNLTGVAAIAPRTYRVVLHMKASPSNPTLGADNIV